MAQTLTSRVVDAPDDLAPFRVEWDELAVTAERPFSAPAWVLAWWFNLRPDKSQLRVVLVQEGDRLVGVVPMHCAGRAYLPIGRGMASVEPLSKPGLEHRVAEAVAATLAESTPRPVTIGLELSGSSPDWAALLADAWGGGRGAWRWVESETPVPRVDLGSGFEDWLKAKSSSFRREMKRKQRKLQDAGGVFRYATEATLERDISVFMQLHRARLAGQGGSSLTDDGVERMLVAVGSELLASGRFRLLCLELDGKPVSAQLLLAAGREVSAWNSGFDEDYAKYSPSMQCIVHALTDAAENGERTMSLGPGGQDYKYRLSNQEDSLNSHILVPPGIGYPLVRFQLAIKQLRRGLAGRFSPAKQSLRWMARR